MPTYKLTYFNARGRAEVSRLLFACAGVKYEDDRIKKKDWPSLKEKTPLGKVPVLTEDGKQFSESLAIEKHLARKFELDGKTEQDKTECDTILSLRYDVLQALINFVFEEDKTKKEELIKTFKKTHMTTFIKYIEFMLQKNGGDYVVGDKVTVADLVSEGLEHLLL